MLKKNYLENPKNDLKTYQLPTINLFLSKKFITPELLLDSSCFKK